MGHVDHAVHVLRPADAVNVPGAQPAHTKLALAVAGVRMKVPARQLTVASTQKPLSEKVIPATHVVHWRSAATDPALAWPKPGLHEDQVVHVLRPGDAANVPDAHTAHSRSLDAVGVAVVYVPVAQTARTVSQVLPPTLPENVEPATQATHWRSAMVEPPTDCPKPTGHVLQFVQLPLPEVALNWPLGHAAHARSDEAVGTTLRYSPIAHAELTGVHAAPSLVSEKVVPTMQAAHARSRLAVGSVTSPWPTEHAAQPAQSVLPTVALNWPLAHAVHTRSDEIVGIALRYLPIAHMALTGMQAAPSLVSEKVVPAAQAAHTRSAVADPAAVWPSPTGHVLQATHASLPAVALKWFAGHGSHARSDEALGAAVSYSPAWHVVTAWHTRSDVADGAAKVNWPSGHDELCVAHSRLETRLGACVSHSPWTHSSTFAHASPLFALEYVAPEEHGAHVKSAMAVPGEVTPEPAAHVVQAAHAPLPATCLNCPLRQSSHTRSDEAVAAVTSSSPSAHAALTGVQAAPPFTSENVEPAVHGEQVRSAVAVPAVAMPSPMPHVLHGAHSLLPT